VSEGRAVFPVPRFPLIFAAPSGAGKTSIARALGERRSDVAFSISATTRPPRSYERDGVDYFFKTQDEFRAMIERGELLEWAMVHGNYYGTPRWNLDEARSRDRFLLLDIDVQGSRQVRQAVPESVAIFVLPPSGAELARRLAGRGSEDAAVQQRRLRAAREELGAAAEFDFVIVNEDVNRSVELVEAILDAECHRAGRIPALNQTVARLCAQVDRCLVADPAASGSTHPSNQ
jgi:guanylate kinase